MVFSSLTFLVLFLPAVTAAYYIFRSAVWRNGVLILFSLFFYAWGEPRWIFVMLLTVLVNYICGVAISRTDRPRRRLCWMLLGVALGVGFLVYFKYFGFLLSSLLSLVGRSSSFEAPVMPIGISFYTFQVLTYTIDVYRGKAEPQKNFLSLLLYVSFFPQLIAGPIVNYKDIQGYLGARQVTLEGFHRGLLRFFVGFAKKVLIANVCGELTESLGMTGALSVAGAWLGALAYSFQIYFDFSGYSDMAIGMGEMFGFHFRENFNYPYVSTSVTDFWRRWHISLGAFFREYVYIPLGGNRVSPGKQIRNLLVVWGLTGLWHGASWNFLLWGLYYGLLLVGEKLLFKKALERLPGRLTRVLTLALVMVGWVIFYHTDLSALGAHLAAMFGSAPKGLVDPSAVYYGKRYLGFLLLAALASVPWSQASLPRLSQGGNRLAPSEGKVLLAVRSLAVSVLALAAIAVLVGQSYNPFLYFRF